MAGVLAAGTFSDRYGRLRLLLWSLAAAPVALVAFAAGSGALRVVGLTLTGFSLLSTTPVMLAMVQERASRSPAAANGLFRMLSFLARSAIVVLVGMCGDRFGLQMRALDWGLWGYRSSSCCPHPGWIMTLLAGSAMLEDRSVVAVSCVALPIRAFTHRHTPCCSASAARAADALFVQWAHRHG